MNWSQASGSQYRAVWRAAILVFLLLGIGAILGTTMFAGSPAREVSSPAKKATGPKDNPCKPRTVRAPIQVTDRYDRQVLSLDPSIYLTLGSSSSPVEPDLSGNGYDGTYEPQTALPGVAKLPNGDLATVFNGHGQYVQVSSADTLSVTATGCITIEAWISPAVLSFLHTQGSGYVYILGKGTAGKQEYALRMYSYSNSEVPPRPNRISAYVFNLSGGEGSGAYFQDKVDPGAWIMVTFVVDSRPSQAWPEGYIAIYKNGQMCGSPVSLSQFNVVPKASSAPFRIATRDLQSFFEGAIGKVAVYNYALSRQDILATYQAMVSPAA